MQRIAHLLVSPGGDIRARSVLPEGEDFVPEPWMVYRIQQRGWRIRTEVLGDSGIMAHGYADWRTISDTFASVIREILDDEVQWSEEEANLLLERAQAILDDYQIALAEVSLANPQGEEPEDGGDESGQPAIIE